MAAADGIYRYFVLQIAESVF